ncbi:YmfQ family protein [Bacillus sp. JJ1503]|uniref:YmfQ family protein n=1 Tax=Bacillus sp. JJ1503 TaxID=3122956 RepID=UPI002FFD8C7E
MKFLGTDLTRNIERDMFDYLPKEYEDFRESRAVVKTEAAEFERLHANIADVLAQFFIDTATWGLSRWERMVGVTADKSKPIDQRRAVVKSKLRGVGTVTVELIKNVTESWYGGEVEVTQTPAQYLVTVEFTSSYGVPANLTDVERALRDIIPAHLDLAFKFRFVTYDATKAKYSNYDAISLTGLTYAGLLVT